MANQGRSDEVRSNGVANGQGATGAAGATGAGAAPSTQPQWVRAPGASEGPRENFYPRAESARTDREHWSRDDERDEGMGEHHLPRGQYTSAPHEMGGDPSGMGARGTARGAGAGMGTGYGRAPSMMGHAGPRGGNNEAFRGNYPQTQASYGGYREHQGIQGYGDYDRNRGGSMGYDERGWRHNDDRGWGRHRENPMYGGGEPHGAMFERTRGGASEGYGDYGHPGEGYRRAYGDMGMARMDPPRGAMMEGAPGEPHEHGGFWQGVKRAFMGEPAAGSRRWRRSTQRARDVMTKNPKCARATDTVQHVAQMMIDEDTGIVPIVDESGRLLGVVTDRDIVCRLVARGADVRTARVAEAMTDDVECVTEQDSLHDVLRLMGEHQVRRVPVVARGDKLVGIISMGDLAREADVDEELQQTFEEISGERGFWSRLR